MSGLDFTFDPADAERADAEARLRWFRNATGTNLIVNPAVAAILYHHGVDMTLVDVERAVVDEPLEDTRIVARYDSRCPACDGMIYRGDIIAPETTETVANYGGVLRTDVTEWRHDVCPTPRGSTVCPSCFLERPCPCEDEQ